jgi:hypothetical protein
VQGPALAPVDGELSFAGKKVVRAIVEVATDPVRLARFAKPAVFEAETLLQRRGYALSSAVMQNVQRSAVFLSQYISSLHAMKLATSHGVPAITTALGFSVSYAYELPATKDMNDVAVPYPYSSVNHRRNVR